MSKFQQWWNSYSADLTWDYDNQTAGISRLEIMSGLANRFLYSSAYKIMYLLLALLSIVCIWMELTQKCPSGYFIFLEIVINTALILEVAVRLFAQRSLYFKYVANIVDIFLVVLCVLTLTLVGRTCDEVGGGIKLEEELDTIFLVLRNLAQFYRLLVLMKRNQGAGRPNYLNIQDVENNNLTAADDDFTAATFDFDS